MSLAIQHVEEVFEPNLGVFDVSVYASIDYEKLRQIKRMKLGVDSVTSEDANLIDDLLVSPYSSDNESFWDDNDTVDSVPSNGISLYEDQAPSSLSDTHNDNMDDNDHETPSTPGKQIKTAGALASFGVEDGWENIPFGPIYIMNSSTQSPLERGDSNKLSDSNVNTNMNTVNNTGNVEDNSNAGPYDIGGLPHSSSDTSSTMDNESMTDSFINPTYSGATPPTTHNTPSDMHATSGDAQTFNSTSVDDGDITKGVLSKTQPHLEPHVSESFFT